MRGFRRDANGAVAAEFGLVCGVFITLLIAILGVGIAFWTWNQATKALQLGVRLAAVSDPVSSDLKTMTGLSATVHEGDPMPYFQRICSGATQTCTNGTYDAAAMRTLVYGRGNAACPTAVQRYPACARFSAHHPAERHCRIHADGPRFAGRPGGPLPSITVRLTGLDFNFVVLNTLLGLPRISMSSLAAMAAAEDLLGR
jgi:Flp pilus assembly pilin Flp